MGRLCVLAQIAKAFPALVSFSIEWRLLQEVIIMVKGNASVGWGHSSVCKVLAV